MSSLQKTLKPIQTKERLTSVQFSFQTPLYSIYLGLFVQHKMTLQIISQQKVQKSVCFL